MAGVTGRQMSEDSLMCSICVDIFRDPVTLLCQHSFCRSCLQMFAEQTPPVQTGSEVDHVVSCPMCRTSAHLGSTGVTWLPTDERLREAIETPCRDSRGTRGEEMCDMCDQQTRRAAVKFCRTCGVLYCEQCLNGMHPMRGPLGRHQLVSMEEYMSMGSTESHVTAAEESPEDRRPLPSCDQHNQPFSMFCMPCKRLICTGCLDQHDGHAVRSIQKAYGELKTPLMAKTKECEKVNNEVTTTMSGWNKLENDVKQNGELNRVDIEKAYTSALEVLNKWRSTSLDTVTKQEEEWMSQCKASTKELKMMTEELQRLMATSHDLTSSSDDTQFVQDAGMLTTRMDNQLKEVAVTLKKQPEIKEKLLSELENNSISGRKVIVKEGTAQTVKEGTVQTVKEGTVQTVKEGAVKEGTPQTVKVAKRPVLVSKPEIKFTRTDGGQLKISEGGSVVAEDGTRGWRDQAWTDGCLHTGRVYWEVELSVRPSPGPGCHCFTGVVREGCYLRPGKAGRNCWYMWMRYQGNQYSCHSHQGGEVSTAYQHDRHSTGAQRLGVFLDCEAQTLTFIDCDNNRVMCTVRGVCVSGPGLSPAVRFVTSRDSAAISVRLVTEDRATLPQVLSDILQGPSYRAIYDYAAADADEISFGEGDIIKEVTVIDDGWMEGRNTRTGQYGMLPSNYVEKL